MRQITNRLPAFLIPIITILLGLAIGMTYIYVLTIIERRGAWEQLSTPPGEMVRLVAADPDYVVVETAEGAIYRVYCYAKDPVERCWKETELPVDALDWPCDDEFLLPPPGPVRDHIENCFEAPHYYILTQYALLEDGTLWSWTVGIYPLGQAARFIWSLIISPILGLIVGIIILVNR